MLTRREKLEFLSMAIGFLTAPKNRIQLKRLPCSYVGEEEAGKITIDYRRDFVSTLIHELLHRFHGDWSESQVAKMEKHMINQLSPSAIRKLLKALTENF